MVQLKRQVYYYTIFNSGFQGASFVLLLNPMKMFFMKNDPNVLCKLLSLDCLLDTSNEFLVAPHEILSNYSIRAACKSQNDEYLYKS